MRQILYPMDTHQGDRLEELLRHFTFPVRGFGAWQQDSRPTNLEGYICDHQITYIAGGTLRFSLQGRTFTCPTGSLLLFEPFEIYTTEIVAEGEPLECCSIHFDIAPEYRQKEFVRLLLGRGENLFLPGELPPVPGLFHNLFESRRKKEPGLLLQAELDLRLIFLYMLQARWEEGAVHFSVRPAAARQGELVQKSICYIQEQIAAPIRVSKLAQTLNISVNYLYQCFMDVLGLSPSRYILRYKVRRSIDLMAAGKTVEEIGALLGFSSPYHFSTTFKQIMGCAPRDYIKAVSRGRL
ncbi:AraC family transcriptional regulator [Pseudoflavonifractor sp. 524-17]|uniref:helix-turn-helix domain-containing protein n=1 Tax=Pseudoflavonifractor sp. 524-17 TaxID=2304577 RepID=UPI00137A05CC|nr:AraC family transcriptional regulator [Pseudoflavonifractor sp. 524-17]